MVSYIKVNMQQGGEHCSSGIVISLFNITSIAENRNIEEHHSGLMLRVTLTWHPESKVQLRNAWPYDKVMMKPFTCNLEEQVYVRLKDVDVWNVDLSFRFPFCIRLLYVYIFNCCTPHLIHDIPFFLHSLVMREPQPIAIPQRHHVTETITDATRWLEESTQRRLVLLNDRARALAASAKFEAAMNDTTTMQTIAPSSGMGYLCAGHVHQLQGRHRACIAICDRGLSVVPSSDTYYQQLVDMRSMAVKHNSVYVDFIKELPGEIVEIIVDKLFTDDTRIGMDHLCQYLSISHIWRDTIVQSIRHLHLVSEPGKDLVDSSGYILKHTAPYAAALTIKYEANSAYKLFQQYQFPSLRYLDLDE